MSQPKVYHIYGLCDPRTSRIRYIGCTKNPSKRLHGHRKSSSNKDAAKKVKQWIAELRAAGLSPLMVVIQEVPCLSEAYGAEAYWIRHFRHLGAQLLNTMRGTNLPPKPKLTPVEKHNHYVLAALKRWQRWKKQRTRK